MVAQMQYQDPLDPQSDSDFLAQLAQVSSTEMMQDMSSSMSASKAYSMIGKYVTGTYTDSSGASQSITGIASSVYTSSGTSYVEVNSQKIPVANITQVYSEEAGSINDYAQYVGKTVSATYTDSSSKATVTVSGVCKSVYSGSNDITYVQVLDSSTNTLKSVPAGYVTSLSTTDSSSSSSTSSSSTSSTSSTSSGSTTTGS
jgi:flagellar basal-body rod modification protein FlgD